MNDLKFKLKNVAYLLLVSAAFLHGQMLQVPKLDLKKAKISGRDLVVSGSVSTSALLLKSFSINAKASMESRINKGSYSSTFDQVVSVEYYLGKDLTLVASSTFRILDSRQEASFKYSLKLAF